MLKKFIRESGTMTYTIILLLLPVLSCMMYLKFISFRRFDFYEYIFTIIAICALFIFSWIYISMYGNIKKCDLSIHIVVAVVLITFLLFIGIIEILPNEILGMLLESILQQKERWEILNRPSYQIARFIIMLFAFPYFASFGISKIILKYRENINI